MLTPQEIQEKTFTKAVFGGYDMQTVDEFLEPMAQDYITLYKENAVLKSKMKVLVKKLEEYRDQEESMKDALLSAQKTCDAMVKEAERKAAAILAGAEQAPAANGDALVAEEAERVECARRAARNFIDVIEHDVKGHLELLESLKTRDLSIEKKITAAKKPYDFEKDAPADKTQKIASEIEQNLSRMGLTEEDVPAAAPVHPESPTIKFTDLQFGKNYDPTAKK